MNYTGKVGNGPVGLLADWLLGFRGNDYRMNEMRIKGMEDEQRQKEAGSQAFYGEPVSSVPITPPITQTGQVQQRQQAGAYSAPTSTGGVLNAVPEGQRTLLQGMAAAFGAPAAIKQAYQTNVPNVTGQEDAYETFDGQHDPYGRGGAGQRNTRTNQIVGYKDPLKPEEVKPLSPLGQLGQDLKNGLITPDQFRSELQSRNRAPMGEQESWGQPVTEQGADGKPIVVRYSNKNGRQIVPGAIPRPQQPTRQMQPKAINDLSQIGATAAQMDRLVSGFKPGYGGGMAGTHLGGETANMLGRTFGDSTGRAQWWQDYQDWKNLARHTLFGAALTKTEAPQFDRAAVTPNMNEEEIQKNLKRQMDLANVAARKLAKGYTGAGYDKDAVEGALGMSLEDITGAEGPTPQDYVTKSAGGPARIKSDADYDALPSGSEFVAPDGTRRRKP